MASRYNIRINVRTLKNGNLYSYVSMSEEVAALFEKPYVSVKRMNDRLAFCQWDNKTGRGEVTINNGRLQFGVQADCEKMQDFCGQYYLYGKTDSGVIYVKLEDRRPFDREVGEYLASPHDKCSEHVVTQTACLSDMLQQAIERKSGELTKAAEEVTAAENLLKEAQERFDKVSAELNAYYVVLNAETVAGE
jgi:hypothetical protein